MPQETKTLVGLKIKEVREELEWPQSKIAEAIGMTYKGFSAYERGRIDPPVSVVKKVAKMTNTPISYFVDEEENQEMLSAPERIALIEAQIINIKRALSLRKKRREENQFYRHHNLELE